MTIGSFVALVVLAAAAAGTAAALANGIVKAAAVTAAVGFLWSRVIAPIVFRPIGRALARGARGEARKAIAEMVEPVIEDLRSDVTELKAQYREHGRKLDELLDRTETPAP